MKSIYIMMLLSTTLFSFKKHTLPPFPEHLISRVTDASQLSLTCNQPRAKLHISEIPQKNIRVLLFQNANNLLIEACGAFKIYDANSGKRIHLRNHRGWGRVELHDGNIKWGHSSIPASNIKIVPSRTGKVLVNGAQYKGSIIIMPSRDNKLIAINQVPVDDYIKSTLNMIFASGLPSVCQDVLDSLAIIARTDSYYRVLSTKNGDMWDVDANDTNYRGSASTLHHKQIAYAISNTKRIIMSADGFPFPCSWTEHCGGNTVSYDKIFKEETPTPSGVKSAIALRDRPNTHWSIEIETAELAKLLKINRITKVEQFTDHNSGKTYALRFHDGSHSEDICFCTLKQITEGRIKSNDFTVTLTTGYKTTFQGHGEGLGTGLCIYSAEKLIRSGNSPLNTLEKFFPGTSFVFLSDNIKKSAN